MEGMSWSNLHSEAEKAREKKVRVYVGFVNLEVYESTNIEALWQVLRMYDVGGKLLNGIESMYIKCKIVLDHKCLRINSGVTWECVMAP